VTIRNACSHNVVRTTTGKHCLLLGVVLMLKNCKGMHAVSIRNIDLSSVHSEHDCSQSDTDDPARQIIFAKCCANICVIAKCWPNRHLVDTAEYCRRTFCERSKNIRKKCQNIRQTLDFATLKHFVCYVNVVRSVAYFRKMQTSA